MGLLGRYMKGQPVQQPADDVLLLHAVFCMAAADGDFDEREEATFRSYATTLPEFRDLDDAAFQRCLDQSIQIAQRFDRDMKASVQALAAIQSEAVRRKAFVLAVDIAMSSGDIDQAEEDMLEALQHVLHVDDDLAERIVEVISLKYRR